MASHEQATREKTSDKERVPQVSSQFESLTVSPAEEQQEQAQNVGKFAMQGEEADADIARYRQAAQQNSIDALRAAEERYNKAKQVTSDKTAQDKDALKQGAEKTSQYAAEEGGQARDTVAGSGKTAADYTGQAKDYVAEKAVGAKDAVAETGKGTAGYVGSVATTVKDKAVVAGWGAGEYTAEKLADATKAAANVTAGAAGYVGDTAVAAKDKVGSVGLSAKDYAAQKLAAAKDAVVATQVSAKDYAARKREEAEREVLAKQSREDDWSDDRAERQTAEAAKETISKPVEGHQGGATEAQGGGGGVLHAIGETVVEIGQTTKDLLVGKGQTQTTSKESADLNK